VASRSWGQRFESEPWHHGASLVATLWAPSVWDNKRKRYYQFTQVIFANPPEQAGELSPVEENGPYEQLPFWVSEGKMVLDLLLSSTPSERSLHCKQQNTRRFNTNWGKTWPSGQRGAPVCGRLQIQAPVVAVCLLFVLTGCWL
jgi:hypothetical protein